MALQSVIKIDHTLSISISIWVVDQSLAHDQQKVIKRSNRSRSAIDHHKSDSKQGTYHRNVSARNQSEAVLPWLKMQN